MEKKKHICKYCGKEFETGVKLGGHVSRCNMNPKLNETIQKIGQKKIEHAQYNIYDIQCPICGKYKQIKMSLHSYEIGKYTKTCSNECAHKLISQNTDLEKRNKKISKSIQIYNQAHLNIYKTCKYCGKEYSKRERGQSNYCSDECMKNARFEKLSDIAKKSNFGGYKENSIKKHHHGNYKGLHYDSSWELAFIIYCLEHNIKIERCNEIRYYEINGIQKKYFPDFIINDNEIIEIKGFYNEISKIKAEQNPDIKILFKNDIKPYIEYASLKYGNNFWNNI